MACALRAKKPAKKSETCQMDDRRKDELKEEIRLMRIIYRIVDRAADVDAAYRILGRLTEEKKAAKGGTS